jgi:hypothetical protein
MVVPTPTSRFHQTRACDQSPSIGFILSKSAVKYVQDNIRVDKMASFSLMSRTQQKAGKTIVVWNDFAYPEDWRSAQSVKPFEMSRNTISEQCAIGDGAT